MKKKELIRLFYPWDRIRKGFVFVNACFLFVFLCTTPISAKVFAQQDKLTFQTQKLTVEQVFDVISSQLKYNVFYSENELNVKKEIELASKIMTVEQVLNRILDGKFSYTLVNRTIVIRPENRTSPVESVKISGVVKDKAGTNLPGVTVLVKGTSVGTATDVDGRFNLEIPKSDNIILQFSFVGMKMLEVTYKGQKSLDVRMEMEDSKLDEAVVIGTGYFQRKAESFTGSATTYKTKDLKMVGKQNILQSLKTLDPSFKIMENREFGSDPNHMPDMEIRGKTSIVGLKQQFGSDPNQPLFILDGFETSIQTVVDLNMERVASITILKDAASTAIYGSRAANGVVVIETKRPEPGELRVSYTGDFLVATPDLKDYNLMNSSEKLEFERKAGVYTTDLDPLATLYNLYQHNLDRIYNERKAKIAGGVDTYWINEPVRTAFTHKHNLYLEGGDESMRYGVGLSYSSGQGVMKLSDRDILSGNFDLLYRKGKFNFSNKLTIDYLKTEEPVVTFDKYVEANPYYTKRNTNGVAMPYLERAETDNLAKKNIRNPLYDSELNNFKGGRSFSLRENFQVDWDIVEDTKLKARIGLNKTVANNETALSQNHSDFESISDRAKKGSYQKNSEDNFSYDGDITVNYGKVFLESHRINFVGGWSFFNSTSGIDSYKAVGFMNDEIPNPSFSSQYPDGSKPTYSYGQSKSTSFFGNLGYSFADRYLLDANIRIDGSSVFGTNNMFTTTWSAGLAWNIHKESFMANQEWANLLKIRASIGNPGNQNFSGYNSFTTYLYNTSLYNDYGSGATVYQFGNPDLLWQKTLDINIGADLAFLGNRLRANANVFRKDTDPLLIVATVASSTGSTSYTTNLGSQLTKGVDASIYFSPIYRLEDNINWTITVNMRKLTSKYDGIGNKLDAMNTEGQGTSLTRYYDGGSPTAIWAVRSAGIDPMTGREVFIKKSGEKTFEHDYADEVVVGNTEPKLEGVIGSTFYYKGLSVSAYFRYSFGADKFNDALYSKVENITKSNWTKNLDRRALEGRWQKPGDIAEFKGIGLVDKVDPMSSRFVQRENYIAGESFSIGYEFLEEGWLKAMYIRSLSVKAYMNNIFRASNVTIERSLYYPYERSVSFSVGVTF